MVDGSIVLVAKCPIPGKSKTRLIPLLGEDGSVALAQAMLSDILTNLTALVSASAPQRDDNTPWNVAFPRHFTTVSRRSLLFSENPCQKRRLP
jgi:hypothetical protein